MIDRSRSCINSKSEPKAIPKFELKPPQNKPSSLEYTPEPKNPELRDFVKHSLRSLYPRTLSCKSSGLVQDLRHEQNVIILVAEWIHFTFFGKLLPTIKLKMYTSGGLMNSVTKKT